MTAMHTPLEAPDAGRSERDALEALHAELTATLEETLRLHQSALAVIEATRRDVEQIRLQLRRLSNARSQGGDGRQNDTRPRG